MAKLLTLIALALAATHSYALSTASRQGSMSHIDVALPIIPSPVSGGYPGGSSEITKAAHTVLEAELYRRSDPDFMRSDESHMEVEGIAHLMGVTSADVAAEYATHITSLLSSQVPLEGLRWHVRPSVFRDYLLIGLESTSPDRSSEHEGVISLHIQQAIEVLTGQVGKLKAGDLRQLQAKIQHGRIPISSVTSANDASFYDKVLWLPRSTGVEKAATTQSSRQRSRNKRLKGNFPGANQDPLTVAFRYGVPLDVPVVGDPTTNTQAVAEFEGEQFYQSDVNGFAQQYNLTFPEPVTVVGPNNGGYFDEGIMDLEYIQGLAPVATYWVAESAFDLLSMTEELLAITPSTSRPTVLSISWGSGESGFDPQQMATDSAEFMKLGLLGISVISAAGDQGTGSTGLFSCGTFDPTWPATSPYVTSVGGTYANQNTDPNSPDFEEIAWGDSGGGFSNTFTVASYQQKAVVAYLQSQTGSNSNNSMPSNQFYNVTGRAFPDVATLGTNFAVYSNQYWGYESGTSLATPSFAAMITRINHLRAQQSKKSIGFLNPALYAIGAKHGTVGFDVTQGSNPCPPCTQGFNAAEGWDPASGWGTPNYPQLEDALLSLP